MLVKPLHLVSFLMDGVFLEPLSPKNCRLALWCIPELIHMTRISDPVVNFDGHNGGGFVIIAESHVAIEQCFQNGVYNGFIDIETCAPERLDQDRVLRYAREALHFWADRTRQLRRQSLVQ